MIALLVMLAAGPTADAEIDSAVSAFRGFKLEQGLKTLGRALERPELPDSERARLYCYMGVGEALRGQDAAAAAAFERALLYDGAVALPEDASPKVRATFAQVKQRVVVPPRPADPAPVAKPAPVATPAPAAVTAPPPEPPIETKHERTFVPLITGAALAVACLAGAIGFGLRAQSLGAQAQAASFGDERARTSQLAERNALVSNLLYGGGALVLALGLVVTLAW